MPRNGSGTYTPPPGTSAVEDQEIDPDSFNTLISDIASALTGSLPVNGSKGMAAVLPMGGNRITGLGTPVASTDAVTKSYSDAFLVGPTFAGPVIVTGISVVQATSHQVAPNGYLGAQGDNIVLNWDVDDSVQFNRTTDTTTWYIANQVVARLSAAGFSAVKISVDSQLYIVVTGNAAILNFDAAGDYLVYDRATDTFAVASGGVTLFSTNAGSFITNAPITVGVSGAVIGTDGNITGSAFGGSLSALIGSKVPADMDVTAVRSVAFMKNTSGGTIGPNGTVAGANLSFSDASGNTGGPTPGGTWKCLGNCTSNSTSLFQRVS